MKEFFGIEGNYRFEIFDLTALITILNVVFIVMGFWWAPMLGLVNCGICIGVNIKSHAHINAYLTQIALIVLNCYFLTLQSQEVKTKIIFKKVLDKCGNV